MAKILLWIGTGRRRFFLPAAVLCVFIAAPVFASGKKDAEEAKLINNDWTLCVTAFDYSQIPSGRRIAGDVITKNLVNSLNTINYRLRVSPEYAYYEGYAWIQSVNTVAKSISQKQDERAGYLYKGDPEWKYKKNIKKVDADLDKLQKDIIRLTEEKPLVNNEPVFQLLQANRDGTYPAAPKQGTERRFCQSNKVDAFLTGEITEFHQRYLVQLKLFTLYSNSWVWEDSIIFSMEDLNGAIDEIAGGLTAVLSGNKPAAISVSAEPSESQILINRNYAGRGTVIPREQPPGNTVIAVAA